jgi:hypothetical protein
MISGVKAVAGTNSGMTAAGGVDGIAVVREVHVCDFDLTMNLHLSIGGIMAGYDADKYMSLVIPGDVMTLAGTCRECVDKIFFNPAVHVRRPVGD